MLVFGQRPRAVIFTSGKSSGPLLEEDLEADGIIFKGFQENEDDEKQLEGDGGDTRSESLASTQKHLKLSSLSISFILF